MIKHWRILFACVYYPCLIMGFQALLLLNSVGQLLSYWVSFGVLFGFAFFSAKMLSFPRGYLETPRRRIVNFAYVACSCVIVFVGLGGYAMATQHAWGGHLFERRVAALGLIGMASVVHTVVLHRRFPWWPRRCLVVPTGTSDRQG